MNVPSGIRGEATLTVADGDTAAALGSGTVPVLSTSRVVALFEQAACMAIAPSLDPRTTTVGMKVQVDHLQPTPVGGTVTAEAWLTKMEGRRLTFSVSASDDRGLVAAGKLTRVVVDIDHFLSRCGESDSIGVLVERPVD